MNIQAEIEEILGVCDCINEDDMMCITCIILATINEYTREINGDVPVRENEILAKKIKSLQDLEHDWDGEGAEPLSEESIQLALHLADKLPRNLGIWHAIPTSAGGICFESEKGVVDVYGYGFDSKYESD